MKISLIAALATGSNIVGNNNQLLWKLPNDMKRFRDLTMGKPCVMGRKTWESIPEKFRPLPNRENIVLTGDAHYKTNGAKTVNTMMEFWKSYQHRDEEFMIIGGAQIYHLFIDEATELILTYVHGMFEGDSKFPNFMDNEWSMKSWENYPEDDKHLFPYSFSRFVRK